MEFVDDNYSNNNNKALLFIPIIEDKYEKMCTYISMTEKDEDKILECQAWIDNYN